MESRMTERLTSVTDRYQPGPKTATPPRKRSAPARSTIGKHAPHEDLETVETMLRTSIEALSPDVEEIRQELARKKSGALRGQPLSFPLVVAAVILVFLIFALDLILTGF
jgi:hypothetical protein